ncbi:MAG: RNA polymerase sigma factor, partial [Catenulispora sp.]
QLYNHLLTLDPTPVVALNRAVAVAEVEGPAAALILVNELNLDSYYLFHAIRADLLARLDQPAESRAAYTTALTLTTNETEQAFLQSRLDHLDQPTPHNH